MLKFCELYLVDVIREEKQGIFASIIRAFLRVASWGYSSFVYCRNWAFDGGFVKRYFPPVPVVVSIGNIVSGGTGKTPMALLIAKEIYPEYQLAILSRGYRSQAEKLKKPVFLSKGEGPIHPPAFGGDEPTLLARRLPQAMVIVGRNRRIASDMASKAGAEVILLDDGMQHRTLARDFEVVVLDGQDPFGHGYLLPRGFLRENVSALSRADIVVINNIENQERFSFLQKQVEKYTAAPIAGTQFIVIQVMNFEGEPIEFLGEKEVALFCAIAKPDAFHKTVENLGTHIVAHHYKPDHIPFTQKELHSFSDRCRERGVEMLLCTEKDRARFTESPNLSLPIGVVQGELSIIHGQDHWNHFVSQIRATLSQKM